MLLFGEGKSFCTGGNVKAFGDAGDPAALVTEVAHAFHKFIRAVTAVDFRFVVSGRTPMPVPRRVHAVQSPARRK